MLTTKLYGRILFENHRPLTERFALIIDLHRYKNKQWSNNEIKNAYREFQEIEIDALPPDKCESKLKPFKITHFCYDPRKYRTPDLTIDTDKLLPTNKDVENFVKAFNNKKTAWLQNEASGTDQSLYSFKFE